MHRFASKRRFSVECTPDFVAFLIKKRTFIASGEVLLLNHGGLVIVESVDSINGDGPDTSIYVIHYKNSAQVRFLRLQSDIIFIFV